MTPAIVPVWASVGDCDSAADPELTPEASPAHALARPKSRTFTLPSGRELHVRGLEVAVDDALAVGLLERLGDLLRDLEGLVDRDRPAREPLLEVLALDELEGEEGLPVGLLEAVDGGDVRVVEGGEEVGLALEAREPLGVLRHLGRQDLDRDVAAEVVSVAR